MTLEQAIKILHPETCTEALNEMDNEIDARKIFDEATILACEVMQREVERQKGCDGCREKGLWEDEVEYGYNSPCTRCSRRTPDNYKPLNDGKVDGNE